MIISFVFVKTATNSWEKKEKIEKIEKKSKKSKKNRFILKNEKTSVLAAKKSVFGLK